MLFAVFALWFLPKNAQQAKFLNEEEKALAFHRMQTDSSSVVGEKINIRQGLKIFKHPATVINIPLPVDDFSWPTPLPLTM